MAVTQEVALIGDTDSVGAIKLATNTVPLTRRYEHADPVTGREFVLDLCLGEAPAVDLEFPWTSIWLGDSQLSHRVIFPD